MINPQAGAQAAPSYSGGTGGNCGDPGRRRGGRGSIVMLGFPFETITTAANRAAVMDRVIEFFGLAALSRPTADFNGDGAIDAADYVIWRKNKGTNVLPGTLGDADGNGMVDDADYQIWRAQFGTTPGAVGSALFPAAAQSSATFSQNDARAPQLFAAPQLAARHSSLTARPRAFVGHTQVSAAQPHERWDLLIATLAADRKANAEDDANRFPANSDRKESEPGDPETPPAPSIAGPLFQS